MQVKSIMMVGKRAVFVLAMGIASIHAQQDRPYPMAHEEVVIQALNYILNTIFIKTLRAQDITLCQAITEALQQTDASALIALKNAALAEQRVGGDAALTYLRQYVQSPAGKLWYQVFENRVFIRQPSNQDLLRAWIATKPSQTLITVLQDAGVPNQATIRKVREYLTAKQEPRDSDALARSVGIEISTK